MVGHQFWTEAVAHTADGEPFQAAETIPDRQGFRLRSNVSQSCRALSGGLVLSESPVMYGVVLRTPMYSELRCHHRRSFEDATRSWHPAFHSWMVLAVVLNPDRLNPSSSPSRRHLIISSNRFAKEPPSESCSRFPYSYQGQTRPKSCKTGTLLGEICNDQPAILSAVLKYIHTHGGRTPAPFACFSDLSILAEPSHQLHSVLRTRRIALPTCQSRRKRVSCEMRPRPPTHLHTTPW